MSLWCKQSQSGPLVIYFYSNKFLFYWLTHSQTVKRFIQISYDYVSVVCFSESQSNKLYLLLCLFVRYSENRHFQEEMENIRQKQGGKLSKCRINHHYGFPLRKRKEGKPFTLTSLSHCSFQLIHWHFKCQDIWIFTSHTLGCETRLSLRHWLIINKNKGHIGSCSVLQ